LPDKEIFCQQTSNIVSLCFLLCLCGHLLSFLLPLLLSLIFIFSSTGGLLTEDISHPDGVRVAMEMQA
jgi:hypothetical protein